MAALNFDPEKMMTTDRRTKLIVISFRLMRRVVGVLGLTIGVILPLIAALLSQCWVIQESISHYYYTIAGDVFVGLLCAVGFFLILYPGEGKWEDTWTNLAGVCALCVAFFPTRYQQQNIACTAFSYQYPAWVAAFHLFAAGVFFVILGGVAFFQFPRVVAPNEDPRQRAARNNTYRCCGIVMWACVSLLLPMLFSDQYQQLLAANKFVFIIEVIALVAFGSCWLIKGMVLQQLNPLKPTPTTIKL